MKVIKTTVHRMFFDEKCLRLICVGQAINVFDLKTMKKIKRIGGFHYLSYGAIDYKHDKLYVTNTLGDISIFNLGDLSYINSVKTGVTDGKLTVNETDGRVCIWGFAHYRSLVAIGDPKTLNVRRFDVDEGPYFTSLRLYTSSSHKLFRFVGDDFYLIKSFRVAENEKRPKYKPKTVYGIYGEDDGVLFNKKTLNEWDAYVLTNVGAFDGGFYGASYVLYGENVIPCEQLLNKKEWISFVRNYNGRFVLGSSKAVYEFTNGFTEKRKLAELNYLSDYCEANGKRYIGAWNRLIVADINEDISEYDFDNG